MVIVFFFLIFVALFGDTVLNQILAVSDVPLYSNMAYNNGRLEWISIIIWTIVLIFQAGIMLLCACEMLQYVTEIKQRFWVSVIIMAIVFAFLIVLYLNLADALKIVCSVAFASTIFSFKLLVVLMLLIASWRRKDEKFA